MLLLLLLLLLLAARQAAAAESNVPRRATISKPSCIESTVYLFRVCACMCACVCVCVSVCRHCRQLRRLPRHSCSNEHKTNVKTLC